MGAFTPPPRIPLGPPPPLSGTMLSPPELAPCPSPSPLFIPPQVMVQIMTGMSSIQEEVTKYLYRWDKYNNIYQLDKDAFIRRFAKANRPLSQFDAEIQKYKDSQSLIQNEETTTTIKFIKVDCAPLKTALGAHCNEWQKKFFTLLNTMACTELDALYEMFASSMKKIKAAPTSLDMLGEQLNLVTKLQAEEGLTVAKFEPLQAQYALLEKYEVSIKEEEVCTRRSLGMGLLWLNEHPPLVAGRKPSIWRQPPPLSSALYNVLCGSVWHQTAAGRAP